MWRSWASAALATGVMLMTGAAACARGDGVSSADVHWEELPRSPLAARRSAIGVAVDDEVLIIGGDTSPACGAMADCPPSTSVRRDGAALNVADGTWRQIAAAPFALSAEAASAVEVDAAVYIVQQRPTGGAVLLRYTLNEDRWEEIPLPRLNVPWALAAGSGAVLLHAPTDDAGTRPDWRLDVATDTWIALPHAGLPPTFDRVMVTDGRSTILLATPVEVLADSTRPPLARVLRLDHASDRWHDLGEAAVLATWRDRLVVLGRWLAFLEPGAANGGGDWARSVAFGGVFDSASHEWRTLEALGVPPEAPVAGVIAAGRGAYLRSAGAIVDLEAGGVMATIEPPGGRREHATIVAVGAGAVVFGGEYQTAGGAEIVGTTWRLHLDGRGEVRD